MLARTVRHRADVSWNTLDDRWYVEHPWLDSEQGLQVTTQTVLFCDTVLAALTFRAESYALCEPQVFEKDGDARKASPDHYLQRVLRNPNEGQTGGEWMALQGLRVGLHGNSYNKIVSSRTAGVQAILPLEPGRVRVLDRMADWSVYYEHTPKVGPKETLGPGEMLHFRGLSVDGVRGVDIVPLIRQAVGIALAAERHEFRFLQKGARLSGLVSTEATLKNDVRDLAVKSWNETFGGANRSGSTAFLDRGFKFTPLSGSNRDAQFAELRDFQVGAILRALGVPGVVVGYAEKTSTYASAKEFFQYGLRRRLQDWLGPLERRISKVLLPEGDRHFLRFNMDNAMRGATEERITALVKATGGKPIYTQNEARAIEDMNPVDEKGADELGAPLNMGTAGGSDADAAPPPQPKKKPAPADPEEAARRDRGWQFALDAAARVVRKEIAHFAGTGARMGLAARYAKDAAGFRAAATAWYGEHAPAVSQALHLTDEAAGLYCQRQLDALLERGVAACESWEADVVPQLAAIAYGD